MKLVYDPSFLFQFSGIAYPSRHERVAIYLQDLESAHRPGIEPVVSQRVCNEYPLEGCDGAAIFVHAPPLGYARLVKTFGKCNVKRLLKWLNKQRKKK